MSRPTRRKRDIKKINNVKVLISNKEYAAGTYIVFLYESAKSLRVYDELTTLKQPCVGGNVACKFRLLSKICLTIHLDTGRDSSFQFRCFPARHVMTRRSRLWKP